ARPGALRRAARGRSPGPDRSSRQPLEAAERRGAESTAGERGGSDPAALPEAAGLRPGVLHQGGFRMVEPPDRAALLVPRLPARVAGAGEAEPGRTEPLGQLLRRVLADQAGGGVQGAE